MWLQNGHIVILHTIATIYERNLDNPQSWQQQGILQKTLQLLAAVLLRLTMIANSSHLQHIRVALATINEALCNFLKVSCRETLPAVLRQQNLWNLAPCKLRADTM